MRGGRVATATLAGLEGVDATRGGGEVHLLLLERSGS